MLVLGIDTSSEIGAVGLAQEKKIIGEINLHLARRHSEQIMVNIKYLLKQCRINVSDLDGITAALGPGSFTGLRIGISTARALSQVLDIPLIGVSSLDVLAYNMSMAEGYLVPVIDARYQRVYTSVYRKWDKNISKYKIFEDKVLSINELYEYCKNLNYDGKFFSAGSGASEYKNELQNIELDFNLLNSGIHFSRGGFIAEIGVNYLKSGNYTDYMNVVPNYLKKPQAELNWLKNNNG